jgi:hypothetical protein
MYLVPVRELLGSAFAGGGGSAASSVAGEETSSDYRMLCTALYDAVVDKNLVLSHQKKANKYVSLEYSLRMHMKYVEYSVHV